MQRTKRYKNQVVRKRFGQNFLTDNRILDQIIENSVISEKDFVLEIGPGHGALTERLLEKVNKVTAVEIDRDLVEELKDKFKDNDKIDIVSEDILKFDLETIDFTNYPIENRKAIGNIPYYITTPIIMKFIGEKSLRANGISKTNQIFSELIIMMQKEVGERIVAKPGTKEYGALSVICQYACHVKTIVEVNRKAFYPAPKVDSIVISLKMKNEDEHNIEDAHTFWKIIHGVFTSRRKTLRNSLKIAGFQEEQIEKVSKEFDLTVRGETLDLAGFAKLSNIVSSNS
ncbi:ribosomal RNA small subunit methyltransferase A [bacterium]|nr:MAG: ribosomal RNA small subunit methyltransferase A [bacterium]